MKITLNGNWKCTFLESDIPSSVITLPNTVQAAGITPLVTEPPTDTQTNWSGILGDLYIKCTQKAHILSVTSNADYDKKKALLQ